MYDKERVGGISVRRRKGAAAPIAKPKIINSLILKRNSAVTWPILNNYSPPTVIVRSTAVVVN